MNHLEQSLVRGKQFLVIRYDYALILLGFVMAWESLVSWSTDRVLETRNKFPPRPVFMTTWPSLGHLDLRRRPLW